MLFLQISMDKNAINNLNIFYNTEEDFKKNNLRIFG